jgi:predicted esterase
MNMRYFLIILCLFLMNLLFAQERIDGSFEVQKQDKKYSIYIPSSYDSAMPQALMIGFHPLNVNRWDSESWRDTLITFAETNKLLLACPDGGLDGRVDDAIDTTFTTMLLDSLHTWYNIDRAEQYAIGFSWGARTAYTYGMNHPGIFKGVIPIGAAIDGTQQFDNVIENADRMIYYIVHGSNDAVSSRYTPVLSAFDELKVCYDTQLLAGVGHTIDFPNRNTILSDAFSFVQDEFACQTSSNFNTDFHSSIEIFPNPIQDNTIKIRWVGDIEIERYELFDLTGKMIYQQAGNHSEMRTNVLKSGVFILKIVHKNGKFELRKLVYEN